jgi:hypothetical protein
MTQVGIIFPDQIPAPYKLATMPATEARKIKVKPVGKNTWKDLEVLFRIQ